MSLSHVWVASSYQDIAKELVNKFKFERTKAAYRPIAANIEGILPILPSNILVTHVPTANKRVRMRGYDQAQLIAQAIAYQRNWRYAPLLLRKGSDRQVGSGRIDRFKHLEEAFTVFRPKLVTDAHILLIDDVTTTGATIEAAAKVLKQSGAKTIDVAVFAQP